MWLEDGVWSDGEVIMKVCDSVGGLVNYGLREG